METATDGIHIEQTDAGPIPIPHEELVERYRRKYRISDDVEITPEMVLQHWNLERRLTLELLDSTPAKRWIVFERCYTELYDELEWLNRVTGVSTVPKEQQFADWNTEVGRSPRAIYEVGSGKGQLIAYLAELGHNCTGTDVSQERGDKHQPDGPPNLRWAKTDGVHLDRFEQLASYDLVLSNQVIEHLHPDDTQEHFDSAFRILKPGGRYLFSTPHRHGGPFDVSVVFQYDAPHGMHLKEYMFHELMLIATRAGFRDLYVVMPVRFRKALGRLGIRSDKRIRLVERLYLRWLLVLERVLFLVPTHRRRREASRFLRRLGLFSDNIFLSAQKANRAIESALSWTLALGLAAV